MKIKPAPRLISLEIGQMAAKLGQYRFARAGASPLPLRLGALKAPDENDQIVDDRIPITPFIHQMSSSPAPGAVAIPSKYLPIEMVTALFRAGEGKLQEDPFEILDRGSYLADLETHCESVIFVPHLSKNDKWAGGLELNLANAGPEELTGFISSNVQLDLARAMIVNLYDQKGGQIVGTEFHWTISWLLGRIKADQFMSAQRIPAENFSEHARDMVGLKYQKRVVEGLVRYLSQKPGFEGSLDQKFYDQRILAINGEITRRYAVMTAVERQIAKNLLY